MAAEVNISSFSGSVSAGDWQPAFTAAYAALTNGGTIHIDTDVEIKSGGEQAATDYLNFEILGNGGNTVTLTAGGSARAFSFGNKSTIRFADIPFIGSTGTGATANCEMVIFGSYMDQLIVERCQFFGVKATNLIYASAGGVNGIVRDCKFGGCAGNHIYANNADHLVSHDNIFYDYGTFNGNYYDRQTTRVWIKAENPPATTSASAGLIDIQRNKFDEGGPAVIINDYPRVWMEGNSHNTGSRMVFTSVAKANILEHFAGYHDGRTNYPWLEVVTCGYIGIDRFTPSVNTLPMPVIIDAATTFVDITNSPNATVTAASQSNYSLNAPVGVSSSNAPIKLGRC